MNQVRVRSRPQSRWRAHTARLCQSFCSPIWLSLCVRLALNHVPSPQDCPVGLTRLPLTLCPVATFPLAGHREHNTEPKENQESMLEAYVLYLLTPLRNSKSFCPSGMENTLITVPCGREKKAFSREKMDCLHFFVRL